MPLPNLLSVSVAKSVWNPAAVIPAAWQYPVATPSWYESGSQNTYVVGPRPDADTSVNAAHRWANTNFQYEQDLFVEFGAPPWQFELVTAPAGMIIGAFLKASGDVLVYDSDYGKIKWPTPTAVGMPVDGWTVKVSIKDQNYQRGGAEVFAEWKVKVDDSKFIVISTTGNNANPGTWASPKADFDGWYEADSTATTYAGKIVVFRGGSYIPSGDFSVNNGNLQFYADAGVSRKPLSFIAAPGEAVAFDSTVANWLFNAGTTDIAFNGDITFNGSKTQNPDLSYIANCRTMQLLSQNDNVYFSGTSIKDLNSGTAGTDNPGFVVRLNFGGNPQAEHVGVKDVLFDTSGVNNGNNGGFLLSLTDYIVAMGCTVRNWDARYGYVSDKSACRYISHYFNDLWTDTNADEHFEGTTNSSTYDVALQTGGGDFMYNKVKGYAFSLGVNYLETQANITTTVARITGQGVHRVSNLTLNPATYTKSLAYGANSGDAGTLLAAGDNYNGLTESTIDTYINVATGEVTDLALLGKYGATLINPDSIGA